MAISATINKVSLNIADMDRHYYQTHEITAAQHPSETDFRFMIRMIAFAYNANESLTFTKGLSTDDEPEIWQKSLSDEIQLWIDLGQLDEKRIRKACGRADKVIIYTYNAAKADVWWEQIRTNLGRYTNLSVYHIEIDTDTDTDTDIDTAADAEKYIAPWVKRNMQLQCNIQEGEMYLADASQSVTIRLAKRK